MEDPEHLARRLAVGYQYVLLFRQPSPALGVSSIPPDEAVRMREGVDTLRRSGLIPMAECVTLETIAESLDDQPPDVRAVLRRLIEDCELLTSNPVRMAEVVEIRRRRYPGVLEGD